jgi:hypothetical protein
LAHKYPENVRSPLERSQRKEGTNKHHSRHGQRDVSLSSVYFIRSWKCFALLLMSGEVSYFARQCLLLCPSPCDCPMRSQCPSFNARSPPHRPPTPFHVPMPCIPFACRGIHSLPHSLHDGCTESPRIGRADSGDRVQHHTYTACRGWCSFQRPKVSRNCN